MDQKLLFLINRQWTGPVLDRFMGLLSSFDAWIPPMLVLIALVLWRGGFHARAFVLTAALIVGINDGLIARTLKHVVDRPRPHQAISEVRQVELAKATPRLLAIFKEPKIRFSHPAAEDVEGRSFPSSHTVNTTSVALVTACFYRRRGWLAFIPALLVGWSRMYTGSHWPSDVLISIFLGLGATALWLCALEWLWRTLGTRLCPAVQQRNPSLLTP
jgi:undecaprenyl-diphosphatase